MAWHAIPVLDLGCGGGRSLALERILDRMDGIVRVYVDPATETAYVTLEDRVPVHDVVRVIEGLGYRTGSTERPR